VAAQEEAAQLRSQLNARQAELQRLRQDAAEQLGHLRGELAAAKTAQVGAAADAGRAQAEQRFRGEQNLLLEGRLADAQRQVGVGVGPPGRGLALRCCSRRCLACQRTDLSCQLLPPPGEPGARAAWHKALLACATCVPAGSDRPAPHPLLTRRPRPCLPRQADELLRDNARLGSQVASYEAQLRGAEAQLSGSAEEVRALALACPWRRRWCWALPCPAAPSLGLLGLEHAACSVRGLRLCSLPGRRQVRTSTPARSSPAACAGPPAVQQGDPAGGGGRHAQGGRGARAGAAGGCEPGAHAGDWRVWLGGGRGAGQWRGGRGRRDAVWGWRVEGGRRDAHFARLPAASRQP
jgi:hypothetical protein